MDALADSSWLQVLHRAVNLSHQTFITSGYGGLVQSCYSGEGLLSKSLKRLVRRRRINSSSSKEVHLARHVRKLAFV